MATRAQIVKKADQQLAKLAKLERSIARAIDDLRDIEWDRPLNASERKTLEKLKADRTDVRDAIEELGFVTIAALDRSDEALRIANALKGVVRDLEARRAALNQFVSTAQGVASIISSLTGLAESVAKLAGSGSN
jgi:hypothetical protein